MEQFFPDGIWHYLIGGLIIGVGVSAIFIITGVRAGASGVFTAAIGYVSAYPYFARFRDERTWRVLFSIGLILGAALFTVIWSEPFITEIPVWRLAVGGLLVGFGTRLARGCTSGHGICGMSSLSPISLVHVITFMAVAIVVANLMERFL
jgi:uncharacterized membrane protein YedE/YeeE